MKMEALPAILFLIVWIAVFLFLVYNIFKRGGWRGALLGGSIVETLGELQGRKRSFVQSRLKLHIIHDRDTNEKAIGLEVTHKTFASWQMTPFTLNRQEAEELQRMLTAALAKIK